MSFPGKWFCIHKWKYLPRPPLQSIYGWRRQRLCEKCNRLQEWWPEDNDLLWWRDRDWKWMK